MVGEQGPPADRQNVLVDIISRATLNTSVLSSRPQTAFSNSAGNAENSGINRAAFAKSNNNNTVKRNNYSSLFFFLFLLIVYSRSTPPNELRSAVIYPTYVLHNASQAIRFHCFSHCFSTSLTVFGPCYRLATAFEPLQRLRIGRLYR